MEFVEHEDGAIECKIDDDDRYHIWWWSWHRNKPKEDLLIESQAYNKQSCSFTIHTEGVTAELAFSELTGATFTRGLLLGGDNKQPDHKLPDGTTVETKFRGRRHYNFALTTNNINEFVADYGVLLVPSRNRTKSIFDFDVEIAGYISRDDFTTFCYEVDWEYGSRLAVSRDCMKPLRWMIEDHNLSTVLDLSQPIKPKRNLDQKIA